MDFLSSIFDFDFLLYLIAGILSSIACGITGTFVVKKKITFVSGGIAHGVLGGVGLFYFLGLNTQIGAVVASLIFALILTISKFKYKGNEDTLVASIWSAGMSLGIIFMFITPGYNVDLLSFIFGNILMVDQESILMLLAFDIIIIGLVFSLYKYLKYVSWDEEYLEVRGFNVPLIYFTLLVLVSLTVVILLNIVGLILIIALLTLPSAIASLFFKRFSYIMVGSVVIGTIITTIGVFISFEKDLPSGATIVLFAATTYILSVLFKGLKSKFN